MTGKPLENQSLQFVKVVPVQIFAFSANLVNEIWNEKRPGLIIERFLLKLLK